MLEALILGCQFSSRGLSIHEHVEKLPEDFPAALAGYLIQREGFTRRGLSGSRPPARWEQLLFGEMVVNLPWRKFRHIFCQLVYC
jgi:hypothetical protein